MNFIWIIVFFLVLLSGCGYVSWHVWQILPFSSLGKWIVVAFLLLCLVCFFANFIFGIDQYPMSLSVFFYQLGNSSIFIGLYLVIFFLLMDLGLTIHLVPKSFLYNSWSGSLSTLVLMLGTFIYGYFNYQHKQRVPLELSSDGKLKHEHRLVMLTDLHLGYHNRADEFNKWIDKVNAENPEVILIAGDIIDGSIRALEEQKMASEFKKLKAPIYACLGNHEYISGEPRAQKFYQEAGIHLLRDNSAIISLKGGDRILVVGRDDRTNVRRSSLTNLIAGQPKTLYTILMDHQPYHLEEAEQSKINFQLSGHTHYGQVWPISWIEDAIYEDAFGPLQKGDTQYYVSSGIGIWGGKFRIGTRSEYIVATIK